MPDRAHRRRPRTIVVPLNSVITRIRRMSGAAVILDGSIRVAGTPGDRPFDVVPLTLPAALTATDSYAGA
jgi:hypothetical protein